MYEPISKSNVKRPLDNFPVLIELEFLDGKLSHREICQKYGITFTESSSTSILNEWVLRYQALGEIAFIQTKGNRSYQHEEKVRMVEEYLDFIEPKEPLL